MLSLIIVLLLGNSRAQDQEAINEYADLITQATQSASDYQFPTNAYEYYASGKRQKFGTYDFVIIGAGSAGTVIANRLTEREQLDVLVLEAGSTYSTNITDIPAELVTSWLSNSSWGYFSTPQETACLGMVNKTCYYPRGKGVGGSTLINGLVYSRGYAEDFNEWARLVDDQRWAYPTVLKYFKKSENYTHRDPDAPYNPLFHGKNGDLHVEYHLPRSPHVNAFFGANQELGYKLVDYNANEIGVSPTQLNTLNGRRYDDGTAFIQPILKYRPNLKILLESYVTKIRINKLLKKAVGVEFSYKGKQYFIDATREVILSAGAIGSPQILMLSGIGPRKHLEKVKIKTIVDLEVGSKLLDHPAFRGITFSSNYREASKTLNEYVEEYLRGVGPLTIAANLQGIGFYESTYSTNTGNPDIELLLQPANATSPLNKRSLNLDNQSYDDIWKNADIPSIFSIIIIALHTKSAGTIRLKSKNPYDYPLINSNFLSDSDNRDINTLYEGVELVLKLAQTKAFRSINATLQGGPLTACKNYTYKSKDYFLCALRQITLNLFHPVGTCPMGVSPREGAVVNSKLAVFGIRNLRVADASVFPFTLAGHPNAPTVMVGEQLSDIIKAHYFPREQ